MKSHDILTILLIVLAGVVPVVAAAPAQYGLGPIAGAWLGLVGLGLGIVLNRLDAVGDKQ